MFLEIPKIDASNSTSNPSPFAPALSLRRLLCLLGLLCLPSLLFVWLNRDVPHFGILQDDGVYFIDGRGLAQGSGYRVMSLPSQPFDTRYPPLYPLYPSIAWRLIPAFPANLPTALMLSWLSLPVVLLLTFFWCRRHRFPIPITWTVVTLFRTESLRNILRIEPWSRKYFS